MRSIARALLRVAVLSTAFCSIGVGSAAASSLAPGVLWSGDLSSGTPSQYALVEGCPGAVSVVGHPAPPGVHAAALTVKDNDTMSACPGTVFSANPAAAVDSPDLFYDGDEDYIGFSTYLPANFPYVPHWFQLAEIYGRPFAGSPPIGIDIEGNRLGLWRNQSTGYDNPWSVALQTGTWLDMVLHVKFSSDPTVGFIEIWLNGAPQTFANGRQRLYMATLVPGVNWDGAAGGNSLDLDQYRSILDPLGPLTIYHAAAAIGHSFAAVAPNLRLGIAPTTTLPAPAPAEATSTPEGSFWER
jgi:Polysaccharide lyase